jgi:hypothetical protein
MLYQFPYTASVPQNGLYEEVYNIQGQATRPSPSNTDEKIQQTEAITHQNPAYENAEFTDSRQGSSSTEAAQGMYESMTTTILKEHTYTTMNNL